MKAAVIAGFIVSLISSAAATSAELSSAAVSDSSAIVEYVAAEQSRTSDVAHQMAPLKSAHDVYKYMQSTPRELSPFAAMDRESRTRFVQSLKFNEKGLTEFDYTVLKGLTPSQVYRVLSLFGMQSGTPLLKAAPVTETDYKINSMMLAPDFLEDYYCESRATCARTTGKACTSNC